jgi:hypothetical protein
MTLRSVCSGRSDDGKSTSSVHESSGLHVDVTLDRPPTTYGQTDAGRGSDEHETSRQQQNHHTDATPDAAVARWTDTAATTSADHQPHDSTAGDQGAASTTEGQTNVD